MSVHLLQLLLHHLLLLLLFISQCSDCSFFFISEKLMKLLKLLFNLKLCVLSLRLKSNHIHFNRLNQQHIYIYAFSRCFYPKRLTVHSGYTFIVSMYKHISTHHIIQLQEKLRHLTYNRPRSRSLFGIYNNNKLEFIILNITIHNCV